MSTDFSHLDPHKSCFELDDSRAISGNLSIPKTAIATMSNWLHTKTYDENTPFMKSISLQP